WKTFCRGHHPLYMDMWTVEREDAEREVVRRALGHTRAYAERMDLLAAAPRGELASSGYCLASPGREYLVYLPAGGTVTVDLSDAKGALGVQWFNPQTGARMEGGSVEGGAKRELEAPFAGDAVLYIAAGERGSHDRQSRAH
ncbi:MAG: putative collagen-binding domain-containing protein, partial [Armatimonadota bacterium]